MTDPRSEPAPEQIRLNEPAQIAHPVVDLTRGPDGKRDRQLLYGDAVTILNRTASSCLIRSEKDGYCGSVPTDALTAPKTPTHRITARSTHAYAEPDFKSRDQMTLSFGSKLTALSETATFIETEIGHIPRQHVHRIDTLATDPATIAEVFLGTPYLWGGNSAWGIDCSGLIQAACLACGIPCPGDSDQQAEQLGETLPVDTPFERNDLLFWTGHVALVCDTTTLIHANAGHMAVAFEPITKAIDRIRTQGDGPPILHKRLPLL